MWTATELASEAGGYKKKVWRVVEAQHRISTSRLCQDLGQQKRLEELAESAKPKIPPEARHLDYLLASPFRYGHKNESRFRRAHEKPGIFYASESQYTAIAEIAYWRFRFYSRSPGLKISPSTNEYSSFWAKISASRALDLSQEPLKRDQKQWSDPDNYQACQALASTARQAKIQCIRYPSVRDREGMNLALLDPQAFASKKGTVDGTWHFRYEDGRLWVREAFPLERVYLFRGEGFGNTCEGGESS